MPFLTHACLWGSECQQQEWVLVWKWVWGVCTSSWRGVVASGAYLSRCQQRGRFWSTGNQRAGEVSKPSCGRDPHYVCIGTCMRACACVFPMTGLSSWSAIEGGRMRPLVPWELVLVLGVSVTHMYVWSVCPGMFICLCLNMCFAAAWTRSRELQQPRLCQAMRFSSSLTSGVVVYVSRIIRRGAHRNLDRWPQRQTEKNISKMEYPITFYHSMPDF